MDLWECIFVQIYFWGFVGLYFCTHKSLSQIFCAWFWQIWWWGVMLRWANACWEVQVTQEEGWSCLVVCHKENFAIDGWKSSILKVIENTNCPPKILAKIRRQWQKDGKWVVLPSSLRKGKYANENANKEHKWKRTRSIWTSRLHLILQLSSLAPWSLLKIWS